MKGFGRGATVWIVRTLCPCCEEKASKFVEAESAEAAREKIDVPEGHVIIRTKKQSNYP